MKKRTMSLFLAKLLAAMPMAFTSQSSASIPPIRPVELAARGEKWLQTTVDSGSFDVVILPRPKPPSGRVGMERVNPVQGMGATLLEFASDFFREIHLNHRDAVVFWGTALLLVLALLI